MRNLGEAVGRGGNGRGLDASPADFDHRKFLIIGSFERNSRGFTGPHTHAPHWLCSLIAALFVRVSRKQPVPADNSPRW